MNNERQKMSHVSCKNKYLDATKTSDGGLYRKYKYTLSGHE